MIVNAYPPRESARRKSRTSKYGTWRSCNLMNIEEHVEELAQTITTYRTDYTYKPSASTRETGQLNKLGLMEYCLYPNGENDTSLCFIYVKRDKKSRGKSEGVGKMQTEEEEPPAAHPGAYTFPQQIADANAEVTIIGAVLVGASSSTAPPRHSLEDEVALIAKNKPTSTGKALEFQGVGDDDAKLQDDWEKIKAQKQTEMEAYVEVTFEDADAIVGSSSKTVPRKYFLEDGVVVTAKNESIGSGDSAEFWNDWEILSVSKPTEEEEEEEEEDMMEMSQHPPPVAPQETYTIGTEDANATVAGLNYSLEDELASSGEALAPKCLEHAQELWDGWKEFFVVDQMEMEEEQHITEASPYPPSAFLDDDYSNLGWFCFEDNIVTIDHAGFSSTNSVPRQMDVAAKPGLSPITTDFHPPPPQEVFQGWIIPPPEDHFNLGGYSCGNGMHALEFTVFDFTNTVPGHLEMAAKLANSFRIPFAFAEKDGPVNASAFDPLPFEGAFQGWTIPPTEDHFSLGLDGCGDNMHKLELGSQNFTDEVPKDASHQFINASCPLGDGQYQICRCGI
ncbi:uncharacterized protein A4U43_C08F16560 [Asparagus officinalis]|uniref:uncharacterized protein LOC109820434 n=1 Tax=Asparagus officinalis TaxID=4686 RepID=UPI00098E2DCF|nr:uncharacterized protein LOC109820434 [Asparagus officinalis]XP_020242164.1 uncharacterized protein LOC109820434 [Asparagus officinalis]XP_020242165.1 uncharacterized protein LOC109820434 [Asparagus officinalis]ONK60288.1 uncharacterized protein A4U43_C08F16560 [Asparagus officinalis]